ncbi:MAG: T9SS type A sorting domain-containing protein [Bacteroidota bacterium]
MHDTRDRFLMPVFLITAGLLVLPVLGRAQEMSRDTLRPTAAHGQNEFQNQDYIHVPAEKWQMSPAYRFSSTNFTSVQVNAPNGQNILGDAANEPSIAIDPTNPKRIAIGWRQFDTTASSFREAGYSRSTDGGQTWTTPGVLEPGKFRSDPVLAAGNDGTLHYYSLSDPPPYTCEMFNSSDWGATWSGPVPAYGGDKQWMAIDRSGGPWDGTIYGFSVVGDTGQLAMTYSFDGGQNFQPLIDVPGKPRRGTVAVGVDGEVYFAGWQDQTTQYVVARLSSAAPPPAVPSFDLVNDLNLGGIENIFRGGPNGSVGMLGQTWVDCDRSDGPYRGSVYVLCSVDPPGDDSLDVYFTRSTDRGQSWEAPVRINDDMDTSAWQWFGTVSVAPGGRIDVTWLDTRDNPGTYLSSLYYSYSLDGGQTWSKNERLSEVFDPQLGWPQQEKMGDYFHMISDEAGASLAWAATFNGEQDIYFGRITPLLPADIQVMSPNGGEVWRAGTDQSIEWLGNGMTHVNIDYSTDGGGTWVPVARDVPAASGSIIWPVPNTPSTQCRVRVTDAFSEAVSDESDDVFTITEIPTVLVLAPNGGEDWKTGSTETIRWSGTGISQVNIDYSTNSGIDWLPVAAAVPFAAGSHDWNVPNTPSANCWVRISDVDNAGVYDVSDDVFAITEAASLLVLAPNGGEDWKAGSIESIRWSGKGLSRVTLEYSTNDGTDWLPIATAVPASSVSYEWNVPNTPSMTCRVRIADAANDAVSDVSDSVFSIAAPREITLLRPVGGETWFIGDEEDITWTSAGIGDISIEVTTDNGATWSDVASAVPAQQGRFSWTVPDTPSEQCRMRIFESGNPGVTDQSASVFSIAAHPSISVLSPNGGESWRPGQTENITWQSTNVSDVVIEYSVNTGAEWLVVDSSVVSTGLYSWRIPNTMASQCLVRISAQDDNTVFDVSDGVFSIESATSVRPERGLAETPALLQNYPNPLVRSTVIPFRLQEHQSGSIRILDILGNTIKTWQVNRNSPDVIWTGLDALNLPVPNGIYLVRLEAGDQMRTRTLIVYR